MFTKWYYKRKYKKFCEDYPINKNNDYYQIFDYIERLFTLYEHIPKWDISTQFEPHVNISIFHSNIEQWLNDCTKYKSQILRQTVKNTDNLTLTNVLLADFFTMKDERKVEVVSGMDAIMTNLSFFYKEIMKQEKANHYYYFGQLSDILITGIRFIEYQVHQYHV